MVEIVVKEFSSGPNIFVTVTVTDLCHELLSRETRRMFRRDYQSSIADMEAQERGRTGFIRSSSPSQWNGGIHVGVCSRCGAPGTPEATFLPSISIGAPLSLAAINLVGSSMRIENEQRLRNT